MRNVLKREANLPLKCLRIPLICRFTTATPSTCLSGNNDNAFHLFVCEFHLYAVLQRQRRPLICLRKHFFVWKQRQRLPLICLRSNAFHLFVCEATATATPPIFVCEATPPIFVCEATATPPIFVCEAKIPYFSGRFGVGGRCPLPPF